MGHCFCCFFDDIKKPRYTGLRESAGSEEMVSPVSRGLPALTTTSRLRRYEYVCTPEAAGPTRLQDVSTKYIRWDVCYSFAKLLNQRTGSDASLQRTPCYALLVAGIAH